MKLLNVSKDINIDNERYTLFDGISINFNSTGLYYIKGQNGCGKTTLFNIIAGFAEYNGELYLDKKATKKYLRQQVEYVYQHDVFLNDDTLINNLLLHYKINNLHINLSDLDNYLRKLDLFSLKDNLISSLSGGEKRKISFIIGATSNKNIIILDEPFSGVDEKYKNVFITMIEELSKEKLIIFSNHENVDFDCECHEINLEHPIIDNPIQSDHPFNPTHNSRGGFLYLLQKCFGKTKYIHGLFLLIFTAIFFLLAFEASLKYYDNKPIVYGELIQLYEYIITKQEKEIKQDNVISHSNIPLITKNQFENSTSYDDSCYIDSIWIYSGIERLELVLGNYPKEHSLYTEVLVTDRWAEMFASDYTQQKKLFENTINSNGVSYRIVGIIKSPFSNQTFSAFQTDQTVYSMINSKYISCFYTSFPVSTNTADYAIYFPNNSEDLHSLLKMINDIDDPGLYDVSINYTNLNENLSEWHSIVFYLSIFAVILMLLIYIEILVKHQLPLIRLIYLKGYTKTKILILYFIQFLIVLTIMPVATYFFIIWQINTYNKDNFSTIISNSVRYLNFDITIYTICFLYVSISSICLWGIKLFMELRKTKDLLLQEMIK